MHDVVKTKLAYNGIGILLKRITKTQPRRMYYAIIRFKYTREPN